MIVEVNGERVVRLDSEVGGTYFQIPTWLIREPTLIKVVSAGSIHPRLLVRWRRAHLYLASQEDVAVPIASSAGKALSLALHETKLAPCEPASAGVAIRQCAAEERVLPLRGAQWATIRSPSDRWPTPMAALTLWVRPRLNRHSNILTNDEDATLNRSVQLTYDVSGRLLVFLSTDGRTSRVLVGSDPLRKNVWTHVGVVLSNRKATLFLDGRPAGSLVLTGPVRAVKRDVLVGTDYSSPLSYYYSFVGDVARVRIETRALSPAEVEADYLSAASATRPLSGEHRVVASESVLSLPSMSWWKEHLWLSLLVVLVYLVLLSSAIHFGIRRLFFRARDRRPFQTILPVLALLILAGAITTNYDLQLFKGFSERYWTYGPVPGLALTGYGPAADALFVTPPLPYAMVSDLVGDRSEIALNLSYRLAFIAGWLLLLAVFDVGLKRLFKSGNTRGERIAWLALVFNPALIVMTLWQPEALFVALALASLFLILERRNVTAGLALGVAFSGKFWPALLGPILAATSWRLHGMRAAFRFAMSAFGTAFLLLAAYWAVALARLGSLSSFATLLGDRLVYANPVRTSAQGSMWSLYLLPSQLPWESVADAVRDVQNLSRLLLMGATVCVFGVMLRHRITPHRVTLACAATLGFAASLGALSVPHFALWGLPFVLLAQSSSNSPRLTTILWLAATIAGTLVSLFIEPISLWLLHVSRRQDAIAFAAARWLYDHVVNIDAARGLGFAFALLLLAAAVLATIAVLRTHRPRDRYSTEGLQQEPALERPAS